MRESNIRIDSKRTESGTVPLGAIETLLHATEAQQIYEWGLELLGDLTSADVSKVAVADHGLLVPTVSSNRDGMTREQAIPIDATVPGSVFSSEEGCTIDDLQDVRGAAAVPHSGDHPTVAAELRYRSLICAPAPGIGVLVGLAHEPEAFDDADLAVAEQIGGLIATAVHVLEGRETPGVGGSSDLLEEIGRMVSHDLRNKLNIATGRLELAKETGDSSHFEQAFESLRSVETISDVVVTLARTGHPLESIGEVVIEEAVEGAFRAMDTDRAELVVKASAIILADKDCLAQLLENLFRNAIEHSSGAVCIEIGLLADGFYIADDGPGIPLDIRESVSELGYSTAPGHDGQGLTIVHRMAQAHGWTIDLAESVSGGTRVEVHGVVFQ